MSVLVPAMQAAIALDAEKNEPISSYSFRKEDEKTYELLSGPIKDALERLAKEFLTGSGTVSFFDTDLNRLIYMRTKNVLLCFVLDLDSSIEGALPYVYIVAEKLRQVIKGEDVDLSVPSIEKILEDEKPQLYHVKLAVLGDQMVGKTSIIHRYSKNKFKENFLPTLGVSITSNYVTIPFQKIRVQFSIWDFGGQDYFRRVRRSYYHGARACFMVFDLTNRESFDNLKKWDDEKYELAPGITTVILGNKNDLEEKRAVSKEEASKFASSRGYSYMETSALTGTNVNDAFNMVAYQIVDQ